MRRAWRGLIEGGDSERAVSEIAGLLLMFFVALSVATLLGLFVLHG